MPKLKQLIDKRKATHRRYIRTGRADLLDEFLRLSNEVDERVSPARRWILTPLMMFVAAPHSCMCHTASPPSFQSILRGAAGDTRSIASASLSMFLCTLYRCPCSTTTSHTVSNGDVFDSCPSATGWPAEVQNIRRYFTWRAIAVGDTCRLATKCRCRWWWIDDEAGRHDEDDNQDTPLDGSWVSPALEVRVSVVYRKSNSWLIEHHVRHGPLVGELESRRSHPPVHKALRGMR